MDQPGALKQVLQLSQKRQHQQRSSRLSMRDRRTSRFDFLADGQVAKVTSTIELSDHQGSTKSVTVDGQITGSNDARRSRYEGA